MKGNRGIRNNKGITLIALVITIIVMLILAGVSLNATIGDNGIIKRAQSAKFKQAIAAYKEDVDAYALNYNLERDLDVSATSTLYAGALREAGQENDTVNVYNDIYTKHFKDLRKLSEDSGGETITNTDILEILPKIEDYYKEHIGVEAGTMIWFADSRNDDEVQWCLELGITVFVNGVGIILPDGTYQIYSKGTYDAYGSSKTYCSAPDLTGFNTATTYYLTYGTDNQTSTAGNPIYLDVPENWFDYGNQRWANVVTVNDCKMSYWTWVPRYVYKITDSGIDCKFVDTSNNCLASDGSAVDVSDYILPESFTFDGKQLPGIWVSKYEISDPVHPTGFSATTDKNSITIQSITTVGNSTPSGTENPIGKNVTIHVSGNGVDKTISNINLPYVVDGLAPDKTYTIEVTTPTFYEINMTLTRELTTPEGTANEIANPDLTGFNPDTTYFVQYDESGKTATLGDKISTKTDSIDSDKKVAANAPEGWYDYTKKRWANIATKTEDGKMSYWTWVPRYKYKVIESDDTVDCIFITKSKTNSILGSLFDKYTIPESFTFGGKELSGIWVSKYEIEDIKEPASFVTQTTATSIRIANVYYSGGNSGEVPINGYILNVTDTSNNSKVVNEKTISIPEAGYNIEGLSAGHTYKIELTAPLLYDKGNGEKQYKVLTRTVTTNMSGTGTANAPKLDGFSKDNTYYVVYDSTNKKALLGDKVQYDSNGNPTNAPAGWYDYANRKWANIVTIKANEGYTLNLQKGMEIASINTTYSTMAMFVWVPRYEYRVDASSDSTDVIFVPSSKTSADSGYTIPEAFTWDGKNLEGYWVAKYEISEIN